MHRPLGALVNPTEWRVVRRKPSTATSHAPRFACQDALGMSTAIPRSLAAQSINAAKLLVSIAVPLDKGLSSMPISRWSPLARAFRPIPRDDAFKKRYEALSHELRA
jgi:hypothetical protein